MVPGESFEPGAVLETVEREGCTVALRRARDVHRPCSSSPIFERFDLSSLRTGLIGGAPCPLEVLRRVREQLAIDELTIVGGMTETSPVSTQTTSDEPLDGRSRRRAACTRTWR